MRDLNDSAGSIACNFHDSGARVCRYLVGCPGNIGRNLHGNGHETLDYVPGQVKDGIQGNEKSRIVSKRCLAIARHDVLGAEDIYTPFLNRTAATNVVS